MSVDYELVGDPFAEHGFACQAIRVVERRILPLDDDLDTYEEQDFPVEYIGRVHMDEDWQKLKTKEKKQTLVDAALKHREDSHRHTVLMMKLDL